MASDQCYLLIDIGTGSSRVALAKEGGNIIAIEHIPNEYEEDAFGGMLINTQRFFENIEALSRRILNENDVQVSAITVSGARQTFFLVDRDNQILFGIPNIDNRGEQFVQEFDQQKELVSSSTAREISADFLAMKLVGLNRNRPDLYNKVKSFTSLSEVFALIFCGQLIIEPSQAVETQMFDLYEKKWNQKVVDVFGLEQLSFPNIASSGTVFEIQDKNALARYGIKNESCKFVVGGADTQLAIKAVTSEDDENELYLVSGTTSPVCIRSSVPAKYRDCWLDLDLKGERYILEFNPGVTGLNYERSKQLLSAEANYSELEKAIDLFHKPKAIASFTTQSFQSDTGVKKLGGFFMSSPLSAAITKKDLIAGIVYDIGFAISKKVKQLEVDTAQKHNAIVACGGGMQSSVLPQIIANLTQKRVLIFSDFKEPSILGCLKVIEEKLHGSASNIERKIEFEYLPQSSGSLMQAYREWNEIGIGLKQI
ncbi:FGGY family carbohydrate kinase [Lacticaseibacillus paracasei]|uniref:FGGY family carbohydrate kinase n=2 Tax=Lacticaseibacillus paracasei TaxID=1597 RepID=A0ABD5D027_LACPA|nr:FGGY family carbohydrate kinase [Lacticaseibacillus paracasei]EPC85938.1 carbohydrate kinase FGGY [Lacticaseibacillus paracasei subsp. paracasei CNCM I-4649]MDR7625484.1 FGGY family carbohydrate kinase [Lacticaseibacillus paracasei]QPC12916.1 hypothetical protein LacP0245_11955 [Lacticaseibacillus paracasei subsp. tolerans]QUS98202.1 hypothetical protein KFU60_11980 [Lacticaseibacillus paracasei subsp. tolerans]WMX60009.1 FGGY family carbohydrate kinase [Lacticaseibacillus paracasei]